MKIIETASAPQAIGPYSQGVIVNNMLYSSGQIGLTPEGIMAGDTVEEQARQVFANLDAILKEAGSSRESVVKVTVYIKNMADFPLVNEIYGEFFNDHLPARSTVEVAALPKNALVEMDIISLVK